MRIYLAARFERQAELRAYRKELEAMGHTVTSRWLDEEDKDTPENYAANSSRYAGADKEDVANSALMINFSDPPDNRGKRGGKHVEFGMALALDIPIILVGWRENVFHYLPIVTFVEDWETAKRIVRDYGSNCYSHI